MAIFRVSIENVSRRTGRSAPAAAAYRSGELIVNERTGRTHDFRRRTGVEKEFIVCPPGCDWANNRSVLWNSAELAENRKDSKVARDFVIAIPAEFNEEQRYIFSHGVSGDISNYLGVAVDTAIHKPNRHGDPRNFHSHNLVPTRLVGPSGLGVKLRDMDRSTSAKIIVEHILVMVEKRSNEMLEKIGSPARVSRLSHAERGDGLLPQVTLGAAASAMERRGYRTEKGDRNREIAALNADTLAHQEAEVRFQAVLIRMERRNRANRHADVAGFQGPGKEIQRRESVRRSDFGSPEIAAIRQPAVANNRLGGISENAVSASRALPSRSERRAAADRRMAAWRASLGLVERSSTPGSNVIARALAQLEIQDEANREALLDSVRLAWGGDGPVQLRFDVAGDLAPVTRVLICLRQIGIKIPTERQGNQRIYRVPSDDLVAALAGSSSADREDFLRLLREAGVTSRAEASRYARQEHDKAQRVAAEAERRQAAAQPQKAMLPPTPEKKAADLAADQQIAAYVRRYQKRDKLVSTPRPPKAPPIVDPPRPSTPKSDAPKDAEAALLARAIEAGIASRNPPAASPAAPAREAQTPAGTSSRSAVEKPIHAKPGSPAAAPTVANRGQGRAGAAGDFRRSPEGQAAAGAAEPVPTSGLRRTPAPALPPTGSPSTAAHRPPTPAIFQTHPAAVVPGCPAAKVDLPEKASTQSDAGTRQTVLAPMPAILTKPNIAPVGTVAARAMLREPVIWEKKGYAWFFMASLKKYELPATAEGGPGLGAALKNLGVTPEVKPIGSRRAGVFRVGISLEDLAAALGRLTQEDLDRWEKRLRETTIDARKAYADYQRRLNEEKRLQGGPEL